MRLTLISLVSALFLSVSNWAFADHQPLAATTEHLTRLQSGGYVLYIRHGKTDSSIPDQVPVHLEDCSTQRPLTAAGLEQMQGLGQALKTLNIPLHPVLSSPFCRALDSTRAAFPEQDFQVEELLMYTAGLSSQEKSVIVQRTRELISQPQPPGSNRVLVAHAPNLAEIMDYFPPEGALIIFKPLGEKGFEYIASIYPGSWARLLSTLELSHAD